MSLRRDWKVVWPRPAEPVDGLAVIQLTMKHGFVSLGPLLDHSNADTTFSNTSKAYLAAFAMELVVNDGPQPIYNIVVACARRKTLHTVLGQLCWSLARALEVRIGQSPKQSNGKVGDIQYKAHDMCVDPTSSKMEYKLAMHVQSAREESLKHNVCGIPTDKANVHSLQLQASVVLYPNNVIFLSPPQVRAAKNQ